MVPCAGPRPDRHLRHLRRSDGGSRLECSPCSESRGVRFGVCRERPCDAARFADYVGSLAFDVDRPRGGVVVLRGQDRGVPVATGSPLGRAEFCSRVSSVETAPGTSVAARDEPPGGSVAVHHGIGARDLLPAWVSSASPPQPGSERRARPLPCAGLTAFLRGLLLTTALIRTARTLKAAYSAKLHQIL